ncbi:MAG: DUF4262 domain-containing protein [Phenylobacterium sp.]
MLSWLRNTLYLRSVEQAVRKHGWAGVSVGSYETAPSWIYSVGFQETLGQPEIVLFDVPQAQANALLWEIFQELKSGKLTLEDGERWEGGDPDHPAVWRKVHASQVDSPDAWFNVAAARRARGHGASTDLEVFQLVLSDQQGRLPWETGYDEAVRVRQPALYLPSIEPSWTDRLEREAMRLVHERGWTTVQVEGALSWAYSIGFPETLGAPEVICFAPAAGAAKILGDARRQLADGRLALREGLIWNDLGFPCCWRRVHESQVMGFNWMRFAKAHAEVKAGRRVDIDAYQLFLSDEAGRYPWDAGCDRGMRDMQPLLFLPLDLDHPPGRALARAGSV